MYFCGVLFGISCIWEKGRIERKQIALAMMFFATVLLGILECLMMVAEVYTAWVIYGIGTAFGGLVFLTKEQHKRNWIGYLTIFLFILGTALMWHYMRDGSRLGMAELIREAYKHPQIYGASP